MSITQTISSFPTAPSRTDPSTFSSRADAFVAAIEGMPAEINTWAGQANTLKTEMDGVKTACDGALTNCQTAQTAAEIASNYQGTYSAGTTYDINDTVSYNDKIWVSKISNNTGNTPAEGTYWTLHQNIPQVITKTANYTIPAADCNGSKTYINAGATADIALTLPAATAGYAIQFCVEENYYLRVNADGTDTFSYASDTSAAGGYVRANTVGTVWRIECFVAGKWRITILTGTLKYDE